MLLHHYPYSNALASSVACSKGILFLYIQLPTASFLSEYLVLIPDNEAQVGVELRAESCSKFSPSDDTETEPFFKIYILVRDLQNTLVAETSRPFTMLTRWGAGKSRKTDRAWKPNGPGRSLRAIWSGWSLWSHWSIHSGRARWWWGRGRWWRWWWWWRWWRNGLTTLYITRRSTGCGTSWRTRIWASFVVP